MAEPDAPQLPSHPRKKIEILIEAPLLRRVEEILDAAGVRVYTVFDGREGKGLSPAWRGAAEPHDQRLIIAIAAPEALAQIVPPMAELFARYPGVIFTSDVDVLRADRF